MAGRQLLPAKAQGEGRAAKESASENTPQNAGAAPRYLHTFLTPAALAIFRADDTPLLKHLAEDGKQIEPENFVPVVPVVLLNGAAGIGTGFSTYVPNHSLHDVVGNIRALLRGAQPSEMVPSWAGFKGSVEVDGKDVVVRGVWERVGEKIRVTELPIGVSIDSFKAFLESEKSGVRSFDNNCTDETVDFTLEGREDCEDLEKELGLRKRLSTANMHLFDANGCIKRFDSALHILCEFFPVRLALYGRRLQHLISSKEDELDACSHRALFISGVIEGRIRLLRASKAEVRTDMVAAGLPGASFDRLLALQVSALTSEEVDRLIETIKRLENELMALRKKDGPTLWEEDLAALCAH